MRLDHLLSKEMSRDCFIVQRSRTSLNKVVTLPLSSRYLTKWTGNDVHTRFACTASLSSVHSQAVSMRLWDTPVPIPNTMVKTQAADGTLLETVRESRWMPLYKNNTAQAVFI